MANSRLAPVPLVLASLVGILHADCIISSSKSTPSDAGLDGFSGWAGAAGYVGAGGSAGAGGQAGAAATGGAAGAGGGAAGACDDVLFDNGNIYACTSPTTTSVFTLTSASRVTSLRLWVDTDLSGQSISYTLLGPTGNTLLAGATVKGGCDPYQTQWCEFLASMNVTLQAGSYTVRSSAPATCANAGSGDVGMVLVKGCAASASPPDAGVVLDSGSSCTNPGPKCQALAACCATITDSAAAKGECDRWAATCVETSCSITLNSSLGIVYCRN